MLGTYCLTYAFSERIHLQPAPSQNAARNIMRAPGFCLMQMSDTNGRPPTSVYVFLGLRSGYEATHPLMSSLMGVRSLEKARGANW